MYTKAVSRWSFSSACNAKWDCFYLVLPDNGVQHSCPVSGFSIDSIWMHLSCNLVKYIFFLFKVQFSCSSSASGKERCRFLWGWLVGGGGGPPASHHSPLSAPLTQHPQVQNFLFCLHCFLLIFSPFDHFSKLLICMAVNDTQSVGKCVWMHIPFNMERSAFKPNKPYLVQGLCYWLFWNRTVSDERSQALMFPFIKLQTGGGGGRGNEKNRLL